MLFVLQGRHGSAVGLAWLCVPGAFVPGLLLGDLLPQRAGVGRGSLPAAVLYVQHADGWARGEELHSQATYTTDLKING